MMKQHPGMPHDRRTWLMSRPGIRPMSGSSPSQESSIRLLHRYHFEIGMIAGSA